jgi:hypothetical protein
MHLDPKTYAGLLAGTLPPAEARALAEHLAGDCEPCERFLAERDRADELDGLGDAAIDRAFPPRRMPDDALAFARLRRRLRSATGGRRWVRAAGAIAASLLVVGVAGLLLHRRQPSAPPSAAWDGVKGAEVRAPLVRLGLARLDDRGEATRVSSGEPLDRSAKLVFELELDRAADVALARVQPGGDVELLWRSREAAGRTVLGRAGQVSAYPLASHLGPQRFVVVASEGAVDGARLNAALAAFRPARLELVSQVLGELSFDVAEVSVR